MKKVVWILVLAVIGFGAWKGFSMYQSIWGGATRFHEDSKVVFIKTNTDFDALLDLFEKEEIISDRSAFVQTADLKKFSKIIPGKYRIQRGASNNDIVNKLRIGDQEEVKLLIKSTRLPEQMAGIIAGQLELDSAALAEKMLDPKMASKYGFTMETFKTMFLPNTYKIHWSVSEEDFIQRMAKEYKAFWNDERLAQAREKGLSQSEVSTLASIVKAETAKRDEAPIVAGLYLNRLKKGIALQADPTLIYAVGDFSIKRVLDEHKTIQSPYNTYLNRGLPPGPINLPETNYLDAVLKAADHNYLYMCAKPDFSGYHNFARTYNQHLQNAKKYHRALDKQRVYR
jgi:UPF0755 protein